MQIYFVSGTDTGVGKTISAALLCRHFLKKGLRVSYVKPVQTGADQDALTVAHICGEALQTYTACHLSLAASPHLASRMEGVTLKVDEIIRQIDAFVEKTNPQVLIVEGAGGLSVPLNDHQNMADLCLALNAGLIIVARAGLGTLNHTFLTLHYAESRGLKAKVIVAACMGGEDPIEKDNLRMIERMSGDSVIARIPHFKQLPVFGKTALPVEFNL